MKQTSFIEDDQKDLVKHVLSSIREEFDDHLTAINENSTEIQANFEYLQEMNDKIEKLREKIDEIHCLVRGPESENKPEFSFKPLNSKEKEIFAVTYALTETQAYVTYEQIARKTTLTPELVASLVANMVAKGIPITKKYHQRIAYVALDPNFRQLQAKENIVHLDTQITNWIKKN